MSPDLQMQWQEILRMDKPKLTPRFVDTVVEESSVESVKLGPKTTVVQITLPNGFAITDSSACVDPDNYDHTMGVDVVLGRVKNKVWELYGFLLQQTVADGA